MGMQFRRRTSGKNGWLNFSFSAKNGVGVSPSIKLGKNLTFNLGSSNGRRGRTTVNLGGGMRYVHYWGNSASQVRSAPIDTRKLLKKFDEQPTLFIPPPPPIVTVDDYQSQLKLWKFNATVLPVIVFVVLTWVFYHIFQWFR